MKNFLISCARVLTLCYHHNNYYCGYFLVNVTRTSTKEFSRGQGCDARLCQSRTFLGQINIRQLTFLLYVSKRFKQRYIIFMRNQVVGIITLNPFSGFRVFISIKLWTQPRCVAGPPITHLNDIRIANFF